MCLRSIGQPSMLRLLRLLSSSMPLVVVVTWRVEQGVVAAVVLAVWLRFTVQVMLAPIRH
jgi:hypothetical protein